MDDLNNSESKAEKQNPIHILETVQTDSHVIMLKEPTETSELSEFIINLGKPDCAYIITLHNVQIPITELNTTDTSRIFPFLNQQYVSGTIPQYDMISVSIRVAEAFDMDTGTEEG